MFRVWPNVLLLCSLLLHLGNRRSWHRSYHARWTVPISFSKVLRWSVPSCPLFVCLSTSLLSLPSPSPSSERLAMLSGPSAAVERENATPSQPTPSVSHSLDPFGQNLWPLRRPALFTTTASHRALNASPPQQTRWACWVFYFRVTWVTHRRSRRKTTFINTGFVLFHPQSWFGPFCFINFCRSD